MITTFLKHERKKSKEEPNAREAVVQDKRKNISQIFLYFSLLYQKKSHKNFSYSRDLSVFVNFIRQRWRPFLHYTVMIIRISFRIILRFNYEQIKKSNISEYFVNGINRISKFCNLNIMCVFRHKGSIMGNFILCTLNLIKWGRLNLEDWDGQVM